MPYLLQTLTVNKRKVYRLVLKNISRKYFSPSLLQEPDERIFSNSVKKGDLIEKGPLVHDLSNKIFYPDLRFISFYKKLVRPKVEKSVSYMRDTVVFL